MAVRRQRRACHARSGVQHACRPGSRALAAAGITPSRSRKGQGPARHRSEGGPERLDDAPVKSLLHPLDLERARRRIDGTRAGARRAPRSRAGRRPPPPLRAAPQITGRRTAHGRPTPPQQPSAGSSSAIMSAWMHAIGEASVAQTGVVGHSAPSPTRIGRASRGDVRPRTIPPARASARPGRATLAGAPAAGGRVMRRGRRPKSGRRVIGRPNAGAEAWPRRATRRSRAPPARPSR